MEVSGQIHAPPLFPEGKNSQFSLDMRLLGGPLDAVARGQSMPLSCLVIVLTEHIALRHYVTLNLFRSRSSGLSV